MGYDLDEQGNELVIFDCFFIKSTQEGHMYRFLVTISLLILSLSITGCVSFPKESHYLKCDLNPNPILQTPSTISNHNIGEQQWLESITNDMEMCNESSGTFSVLSLSGGGPDGAFGAGFLVTRLEKEALSPCLVTGVSTGAIMASYVYLATSKDTERRSFGMKMLKSFYQGLDDKNLVSKYSFITLPFHVSLYDVSGIRSLLKERVNEGLLNMINMEYQQSHRRLAIGATDIATGDFDIIDLTEYIDSNKNKLAQNGIQACYQEAIRASAAIPLVFPPVPIEVQNTSGNFSKKVYVDGGVRHMMFINAHQIVDLANNRPVRVYAVVNKVFGITGKNSVTLLQAANQNINIATDQLYMDAAYSIDSTVKAMKNSEVLWATILGSDEANACRSKLNQNLFNPEYQECLYELGTKVANTGPGWSNKPWPNYIFMPH
jgi:predicted acylesterase/phospholipase RssA